MVGIQGPAWRSTTVSILVSVAAAVLAVAHAVWPKVQIDWLTMALLVMALLPWAAPLFKTIEVGPSGVKLETRLREVREELHREAEKVEALANRVERVEGIVFSGEVTPQHASQLAQTLHAFHDYLSSLGFKPGPYPQVRVGGIREDVALYDPEQQQVWVGVAVANDPDILCKSYSHRVLFNAVPRINPVDERVQALESGLGDYFVCSHSGNPRLGHRSESVWSARLGPAHPFIRTLDLSRGFNDLDPRATHWDVGEVWGAAFWELRTLLGQASSDRLLATAWLALDSPSQDDPVARFVMLAEQLAGAGAVTVRDVFRRRGVEFHLHQAGASH